MPRASEIRIVDFSPEWGDAFERLNVEWLEKYFEVEPIDREVLRNPQEAIIEIGGVILYAIVDDRAVGTVALKHFGDGIFEVTKMAVTDGYQGRGIGRRLLESVIARYVQLQGRRLFLESNSRLTPALGLYESAGFRHRPSPRPSEYARSDVYMVYQAPSESGAHSD